MDSSGGIDLAGTAVAWGPEEVKLVEDKPCYPVEARWFVLRIEFAANHDLDWADSTEGCRVAVLEEQQPMGAYSVHLVLRTGWYAG